MKLEDLKKGATISEMALIEVVEKLVRDEYNIDKIRKAVHSKLKDEIYKSIEYVMKKHEVFSSVKSYSPYSNGLHFSEYYTLRNILYDVGDAIRLELKEDAEKI